MNINTAQKKILSLILCVALSLSMAFSLAACGNDAPPSTGGEQQNVQLQEGVIGEGATAFAFTVVDADGNETKFEVHTDQATVGDALIENGLIAGDEGEFGLYVKEVNGIVADYDVDQTYWAFYIDGEYATSGVDMTEITEGSTYMFKVEK